MDTSNAWNQPMDQSGWDVPDNTYLDPRTIDHQYRVGGLGSLVSFWMQGVRAAERGEEVAKMAKFYDDLEAQERPWGCGSSAKSHSDKAQKQWGEWGSSAEDWNINGDDADWGRHIWPGTREWDWPKPASQGADAWVFDDNKRQSDDNQQERQGEDICGSDAAFRDVWELASTYARDKHVRPERRRQMYDFLEMPTEDKVQKIQEMVYRLQTKEP